MAEYSLFKGLTQKEKALVCIAVLFEEENVALDCLGNDKERGALMRLVASNIFASDPEVRIPLIGTILRETLQLLETFEEAR